MIWTTELLPSGDKFLSFRHFFDKLILLTFLRVKTFAITFFGSLLDVIQWQSSTLLGSTITSNFSKMPSTVLSRSLFSIVSGMPLSSKHSRLEYWPLLYVCHSRLTTFSLRLVFTSLVIDKFDLRCSKSFFKSGRSFLIHLSEVPNLIWRIKLTLWVFWWQKGPKMTTEWFFQVLWGVEAW